MKREFLKDLLTCLSPSGEEQDIIEIWNRELGNLSLRHYYQDKMGNSAWSLGSGAKKVMISGHVDEICMAVSHINKDGYITLTNMAGIDKKTAPGSVVCFITEKEIIEGTVQTNPIHIYWKDDNDKVWDWKDMKIDVGAESKEEVEEMGIYTGCPVVWKRNIYMNLGKNRLVGNALDDKAGVYVTYEILSYFKSHPSELPSEITLIGVALTGEESGLRGARMATKNINPDLSIDFDVTFANIGLFGEEEYGDVKLGKGPVIQYGQDKSRKMSNCLRDIAKAQGVPYQIQVARCGGTNTAEIQEMAKDCETTLISLPLSSMHTQNETMDWRDIEGTVKLMIEYIKSL